MTTLDEKRNEFMVWAQMNGIPVEHEEDTQPWWECWCAGYDQAVEDVKIILREAKK